MVNDGFFFKSTPMTSLFYINYYMSDLLRLDRTGNVEYKSETIDKIQEAPKTVSNGRFMMLDKNVKIVNIDATADYENIFVLSNSYNKKEAELQRNNQRYLDIYDSNTGKYQYSVLIPSYKNKKPYMVRKIKDGFLIAHGFNLVKYSYN